MIIIPFLNFINICLNLLKYPYHHHFFDINTLHLPQTHLLLKLVLDYLKMNFTLILFYFPHNFLK